MDLAPGGWKGHSCKYGEPAWGGREDMRNQAKAQCRQVVRLAWELAVIAMRHEYPTPGAWRHS